MLVVIQIQLLFCCLNTCKFYSSFSYIKGVEKRRENVKPDLTKDTVRYSFPKKPVVVTFSTSTIPSHSKKQKNI